MTDRMISGVKKADKVLARLNLPDAWSRVIFPDNLCKTLAHRCKCTVRKVVGCLLKVSFQKMYILTG